ncbi:transposase family protein [Bacillus cytotoxicus]
MYSLSWLSPDPFLELIDVSTKDQHLRFTVKSNRISANCPSCHSISSRRHSRYTRRIQDLPITDQPVILLLVSHKWFCDHPCCSIEVLRKIVFSTSCLVRENFAHAIHCS